MCGGFGFVGATDLDQNDIGVLVRRSQQRGMDLSGLIAHDGDNYAVDRADSLRLFTEVSGSVV